MDKDKHIKKVSFNLDENLVFKLKQKALDERTTQTELITRYLKKGLNE